jgi:cytochrome c biogenesis protein CcmG/thiol:disulfide interchange protein DsbE
MAAIVLVAVFYLAGHRRPAAMTNVSGGNHPVAPAFLLTDLNGRRLELSNYRGKVVLLDFWATWCAPCRTEIPHFVELQKQYGTQGFQVVGISMDDGPKPVREFYDRFHLNYPVAMGDEQVADAYGGILGLPVNILVSRDGRICARHAGLTDANILEQEIAAQLQRTGEPAAPK